MIIKAIEVVSVAFLFVMALQWTWPEQSILKREILMDEKSNKTAPKSDLEKTDLKQVLTKLKVDPKTGLPLVIQHNSKQLCSCN